jgi:hypothetical protein
MRSITIYYIYILKDSRLLLKKGVTLLWLRAPCSFQTFMHSTFPRGTHSKVITTARVFFFFFFTSYKMATRAHFNLLFVGNKTKKIDIQMAILQMNTNGEAGNVRPWRPSHRVNGRAKDKRSFLPYWNGNVCLVAQNGPSSSKITSHSSLESVAPMSISMSISSL